MTDTTPQVPTTMPVNERIVFALRQAAFLAVALLVAGLVTERLRPAETLDRGIASTPYLWAVVFWLVVLLVNALAFESSQTRLLEGTPLLAATAIGAFLFVTGLVSLDAGAFGRRFVYLFATSLGAVMFWWAAISLGYLVGRLIAE